RSLHLLDRRIGWRITKDTLIGSHLRSLRGCAFRQSEIQKDDVIALSYLQILRLDVAMNDRRLVRVQIIERIEQLVSPVQHFILREWLRLTQRRYSLPALFQHRVEIVA